MGIMGFQDALYEMGIAYGSAAVDFADESMEVISYYAIQRQVILAVERGTYSTFKGSVGSRYLANRLFRDCCKITS
jgi:ribonucleoside-diphosphate reductase alpha chain